jgi:hypothetical protein
MLVNGEEYVASTKRLDARGRLVFSPDMLESAGAKPGDIVEILFRVKKVE